MKKNKGKVTKTIKWWKIAIFSVVGLVCAGAIAYGIITLNTSTVKAKSSNGNSTIQSNAPSTLDLSDLAWVKNLSTPFTTNDYVFVFIPGNDAEINQKTETDIDTASEKIIQQGVNITDLVIDQQNPEYSATVSRLSDVPLPVVFAVSKTGNGLFVFGDITETKLLNAFLTLAKACAPGSGSNCCP